MRSTSKCEAVIFSWKSMVCTEQKWSYQFTGQSASLSSPMVMSFGQWPKECNSRNKWWKWGFFGGWLASPLDIWWRIQSFERASEKSCNSDAPTFRWFRHLTRMPPLFLLGTGRRTGEDPGHPAKIVSLIWPGKDLVFSWISSRRWLGRKSSGLLYLGCLRGMDGWMAYYV